MWHRRAWKEELRGLGREGESEALLTAWSARAFPAECANDRRFSHAWSACMTSLPGGPPVPTPRARLLPILCGGAEQGQGRATPAQPWHVPKPALLKPNQTLPGQAHLALMKKQKKSEREAWTVSHGAAPCHGQTAVWRGESVHGANSPIPNPIGAKSPIPNPVTPRCHPPRTPRCPPHPAWLPLAGGKVLSQQSLGVTGGPAARVKWGVRAGTAPLQGLATSWPSTKPSHKVDCHGTDPLNNQRHFPADGIKPHRTSQGSRDGVSQSQEKSID